MSFTPFDDCAGALFPGDHTGFPQAAAYHRPMSDVTQLLSAIEAGDPRAGDQLLPLVYEELRKLAAARMAQEQPGQTLQATALVHEAWLRLGGMETPQAWNGRGHFFGAAAEAMRRILVDRARKKGRIRHGGMQNQRDNIEETAFTESRYC